MQRSRKGCEYGLWSPAAVSVGGMVALGVRSGGVGVEVGDGGVAVSVGEGCDVRVGDGESLGDWKADGAGVCDGSVDVVVGDAD